MKFSTILSTIALLASFLLGSHAPACRGDEAASRSLTTSSRLMVDDPIRSGRDSLNRFMAYPWYDSSNDDLQPVNVPAPSKPWSIDFQWAAFLQWLAWILLCMIAIFLIYFALRIFWKREIRLANPIEQKIEPATRDRIESLPFPVAVGTLNLFEEARRLYQAGDYAKAIVFLFSYQLVELDKQHLIRLTKGKTNRQYLREVGGRLSLRQLVEQTMIAFEDAFFGHHALDKNRFESCWFRMGEFERLKGE